MIDKDMGVLEAYKASWHATKGHLGKLWGILGVGLLMALPAVTIIGIVATVYLFFMYSAVGALFYLHLRAQRARKQV
jgi:predicted lipid-binding transport protein (Tim44 family)